MLERIKKIIRSNIAGFRFLLFDNHGEQDLPDQIIRNLAKAFLRNIVAYMSSEKGKEEYRKWHEEQLKLKTKLKNRGGKQCSARGFIAF